VKWFKWLRAEAPEGNAVRKARATLDHHSGRRVLRHVPGGQYLESQLAGMEREAAGRERESRLREEETTES